MKYSGSYGAYIVQIGLHEFYFIYSTLTQIASYRSQINKVKNDCMGSTKGVMKGIKKPNSESTYIFLYHEVMKG